MFATSAKLNGEAENAESNQQTAQKKLRCVSCVSVAII